MGSGLWGFKSPLRHFKTMKKGKIAVFISGRGSNLQAIHKYSKNDNANYRIVLVFSDNPQAAGLTYAVKNGLPTLCLQPEQFNSRKEYESELLNTLLRLQVELICLAGYMRVVGKTLLENYGGRIINIHPSLLPSFPGLHAQKQALEYGVRISGCTVHFVDRTLDGGPIILQQAVSVLPADSEESLARRILKQEHRLYPRAIQLFFENRLKLNGRRVEIE